MRPHLQTIGGDDGVELLGDDPGKCRAVLWLRRRLHWWRLHWRRLHSILAWHDWRRGTCSLLVLLVLIRACVGNRVSPAGGGHLGGQPHGCTRGSPVRHV